MKLRYLILSLLTASLWALPPQPCDVSQILLQLSPAGQWSMSNNDPATLNWVSGPQPKTQQITDAVASCQANQVQLSIWQVELSTTQTSLIGKTTGYVAANAITQVQINAKLARIAELRALLGGLQ
jgi:hypothetical protein